MAINRKMLSRAAARARHRQAFVGRYIQSLVEFPPHQKPGSFNLQGVLDKLSPPPEGVN
ncbi:MAG TPA: hypothetical protein VG224_24965 [Reyranella sp.]|jgi:hypothetical protein|nr:hypothetical protein [Reyranella sp.]